MDEETRNLTDRLFEAVARKRQTQLDGSLKSLIGDAVNRGILGAGFFHANLADRFAQELEIRAGDLLGILRRTLESGPHRLSRDTADELKQYALDTLQRQRALLEERLRNELLRFGAYSFLIERLTDAMPNVREDLFAQVDLYVREKQVQAATVGAAPPQADVSLPDPSRVFVVHGRDLRLRADFFSFLRELHLHPIEWTEALALTGKGSPYIGEVLDEAFGHAQAVIVLLSPDDEVALSPELHGTAEPTLETDTHLQARPNVLFEAGMAFGRSVDRTILVEVGTVKPFSDVAGRHTVRLDNSPEMRRALTDRLITAGCAASVEGESWKTVGDLSVDRGIAPRETDGALAVAGGGTPVRSPAVKWVDIGYPTDSGLQAQLEKEGFKVRWSLDSKVARHIDIEGWTLATQEQDDGRQAILKLRDYPENQTLLMKPSGNRE